MLISQQAVDAIETSRRVGWAKYYDAQEEIEVLRTALVELAELVVFDPRIRINDPILAVAQTALTL